MRKVFVGVFLALIAVVALPARSGGIEALEVGLQAYPVGFIGSVAVHVPLSERTELRLGIGFNDADREDEGELDDEQASGAGIHAAFRRFRGGARSGWSWGGRLDVWDLEVDWIDGLGTPGETSGRSDTLVLQPTAVLAYGLVPGPRTRLELSLGAGAEINVSTDGPDVGEGAIGLAGVSLVWGTGR